MWQSPKHLAVVFKVHKAARNDTTRPSDIHKVDVRRIPPFSHLSAPFKIYKLDVMLVRNEDVRGSQIAKHKTIFVQSSQCFRDFFHNFVRSCYGILVKQLLPINVIYDDHREIAECGSIAREKGRSKTLGREQGVGFLVVCFSKLDNNLPIVLGDSNKDRLAGFWVWVCVFFVP